ncbi:response regulator [Holosporaceae bacterium 'Namur']|nr:response regulator [Holosporaceae bacterium 'Namur']
MMSYIPAIVVFLIYFFTLVVTLVLGLKVSHYHTVIEPLSFFISLCAAGVINFFILKKISLSKKLAEYQTQIFSTALSNECEFYIILNDNNQIVFLDPNLSSQVKLLGSSLKPSELDSIFELLNIKVAAKNSITDAINKVIKFSTNTDVLVAFKAVKVKLVAEPFSVYDPNDKTDNIFSNNKRFYVIKGTRLSGDEEIIETVDKLGCGYYELDELGHIIQCNDFFARALGFRREELLDDLVSFSNFIQADLNLNKDEVQNTKTGHLNNTWQGFVTLSTKFNEQIHALVVQKAFYSETRAIKKITGYFIKLPDKSLITRARGVEEGWIDHSWQCFFKDSPYPVALLKKDGKIMKMNRSLEIMVGNHFINDNFINLFTPESQKQIKSEMQKISADIISPIIPLKNLKLANGKTTAVYMGRILDLSGNLYGFMPRITDVTQQKEMEESLSHALRMQTIGYLAGSIAHDFNNLLTAILGFCDILLIRHTPEDPSFAHIMQIRQSANRASSLVNRLLAFSRRQTLKPEILNLNEFFGDFYSLIQRLVGAEIQINQEIASDLWYIKFDPVQFEQVVLNLAINAQQSMGENGKLSIRAFNLKLKEHDPYLASCIAPKGEPPAVAGEYIVIEVEDTGTGIDESIANNIFEPFFTTKQDKSGTGLGLSTVFGIVTQSGGKIYFKTKLGEGTTFVVLIPRPVITAEEQNAHKQIQQKTGKDVFGKGLIILVEDEEAVRVFAKHVLISKGYEVIDFALPHQALNEITVLEKNIDLIITDVVMPGMSGPTLVDEIKKVQPKIKVIFISGFGEEAFNEAYGNARDFNFLPKPFNLKELLLKVKEVIDG